jgi:hypothetical protein
MKAWDSYSWQPLGRPEPPPVVVHEGVGWDVGLPHAYPVVIISHPGRVANKAEVCVLMCATGPASRQPEAHDVQADEEADQGSDKPSEGCQREADQGPDQARDVVAGQRMLVVFRDFHLVIQGSHNHLAAPTDVR